MILLSVIPDLLRRERVEFQRSVCGGHVADHSVPQASGSNPGCTLESFRKLEKT